MHGYVSRLDQSLANLVRLLPQWVHPIMSAATFIGEPLAVLTAGLIVVLTGLFKGAERLALAGGIGFVAFGINTFIKHAVHRTRPDTLYAHSMQIKSYSFPSGHAFGSMFFYGLLAYLALAQLPRPWNIITAAALMLLIFLIGVSRVYLGAHFPSDVLAGWLFGAVCLILVIKLVKP